jgi:hypothetical protein
MIYTVRLEITATVEVEADSKDDAIEKAPAAPIFAGFNAVDETWEAFAEDEEMS